MRVGGRQRTTLFMDTSKKEKEQEKQAQAKRKGKRK